MVIKVNGGNSSNSNWTACALSWWFTVFYLLLILLSCDNGTQPFGTMAFVKYLISNLQWKKFHGACVTPGSSSRMCICILQLCAQSISPSLSHTLQIINEPMFLITGLEPFTEYEVQVAGINQYTTTFINIFGPEKNIYTLEGGIPYFPHFCPIVVRKVFIK